MPNWCNNTVKIFGSKEKIKALWEGAQANGLLNTMVPIGEWDKGSAVGTWGTKWDVEIDGLEYEEDDHTATISGWVDSAWSPPVEAFETYHEANQDVFLDLYYFEPGLCFTGYWSCAGIHDYFEYSDEDLDAIPSYMREHWNIEEWHEEMVD